MYPTQVNSDRNPSAPPARHVLWTDCAARDSRRLDLKRIRFLPSHEVNEELFFVEETRKVLTDNTFFLRPNWRRERVLDHMSR